MATGDLVKLGTLYTGGAKRYRPTNPVSGGDIYANAALQGSIEIRNTDVDDRYKLQWREVNDGGKKYLVSDRVILSHISWDDLNAKDLIFGKTVKIDGKLYKLRSLTGGNTYRSVVDFYAGGRPENNEWDRWIVNEAELPGLPTPTGPPHTQDSPHNQFWNWFEMSSWVQELHANNNGVGVNRGKLSAGYFTSNSGVASRSSAIGWRPVLEEIKPPSGKLKDQAPGTVINFADSLWTILDPATGYLLKNESIGTRSFAFAGPAKFSLEPTNIGGYLNTDFFNSLPPISRASIRNSEWDIGPQNSEESEKLPAKIGMLSTADWGRYSIQHNSASGVLKNPVQRTWTLSPLSTTGSIRVIETNGNYINGSLGGSFAVQPSLRVEPNTNIVNGTVVHNAVPTITLNTPNNATLYENDTFLINGTAHEPDLGDIVNVWYQINSGTARAIATQINTGNPVEFSEQLTFRGGKLHLPNGNALTGALADGIAHKLKVWAEDNKGGKSTIAERTFYAVPNRAPSLTIDPFESLADLIDADRVAMSGDSHDLDGNDVTVRYRINNGINTEIHSGPAGRWSFDFPLSKLKDGENTIVVEVVDTYDFKYSRTIRLTKTANLTPLEQSVQRYTIVPPAGSAQGVLFWVKRDESQGVSIEISMTNGTEPENFVPMTLDSSGPDEIGTVEDFFKHRADAPAEKIAIKLSWTGDKPIHQIQGALTQ